MAPRSRDWNESLAEPSQDTIDRLLKPFRLKLSLARIEETSRRPRGRPAVET